MILSLYDFTGTMTEPWARAGHTAVIVDLQHTESTVQGSMAFAFDILEQKNDIIELAKELDCTFLAAFPPCTDLAISGAAHFKSKQQQNPLVHLEAIRHLQISEEIGIALDVPYLIENPVSLASSYWRQPDYSFHPWEFGGYLPRAEPHPRYPDYIPPQDAYPKKTCLWVGGGFTLPTKRPVPIWPGLSNSQWRLGGKSLKTKNIRSETPRGFAQAVFEKYGRSL